MRYYLDTEFDGFHGPLISLALVREDGPSVYLVTNHEAQELWVRENVVPIMFDCPIHPIRGADKVLAQALASFLEADKAPVIISDWPADIRYFCELIEFENGKMAPIRALDFKMVRVDAYPTTLPHAVQHNAWWDAMALRHEMNGSK